MSTDIKNSNKAHERHDSTGVTVAKVTWKVRDSKARDEKIEGGSESLVYGRQNSGDEEKGSVGFQCQFCQRIFPKQVGLSLHLTRWCKLNPSGAGSSLPLAADASMDNSAQNHQSSNWSYPLTHGDFKRPSEKLDTIQTRPRLKLPNASNRRKWKDLDDFIFTAIVSSIADSEFRKGDIGEVLGRFRYHL